MVVSRPSAADAAHGEALGDLALLQLGEDGQNADYGSVKRGEVSKFSLMARSRRRGQQLVLNEGKCPFREGEPIQLVHHQCVRKAGALVVSPD